MNERLFAIVSGRVQMVMYRDFTQRKASALKLMGQVRNLKDGTVEIVAEGPRIALEKLLKKLEKGSLLSSVETISSDWRPPTGEFSKFKIAHD